jgi:anti-sigma B factor antagonist
MRIIQNGERINVSGLNELDAASAPSFESAVRAVLPAASIDIDLSRLSFIDCGGVGALIALRNSARSCNADATIRLLNPSRRVRRMFQVTRLDKLFRIKNHVSPSNRTRGLRKAG